MQLYPQSIHMTTSFFVSQPGYMSVAIYCQFYPAMNSQMKYELTHSRLRNSKDWNNAYKKTALSQEAPSI